MCHNDYHEYVIGNHGRKANSPVTIVVPAPLSPPSLAVMLAASGRIPTENRLLWVDFVEIIWVTILSKQAAEQARSAEVQDGVDNEET